MQANEFKPGDEVVCGESSCKVVSVDGDYCTLSDSDYLPEHAKRYAVEFTAHFTEVAYDYGICPDCECPLDKESYCQHCEHYVKFNARFGV